MAETPIGGEPPPRLVISAEDLDDVAPAPPPASPLTQPLPLAPLPGTPIGGGPASIGSGPASAPPPAVGPPGAPLPRLTAPAPPMAVGKAPTTLNLASLGANSVVAGLLAGTVGGIVGALVAEVVPDASLTASESAIRAHSGLWVAVFGAVLGFTIRAWDGITSGSAEKAVRDGALGAVAGAVGGFVGGYTAQALFSVMVKNAFESGSDPAGALLVARVVGWGIFGGIAGLGLGLPGGQKKAINSVVGGLIGGAAGGFLFQQLATSSDSQTAVRVMGLAATGAGIGLGVGIVDRLRRDAWIRFTAGPMAGKELILFKPVTSIGRDHKCDIVLVKDESVFARHALLVLEGGRATTVQAEPGAPVAVNGVAVTQHRLRSGDQIAVGRSTIQYQERASNASW